jgi:hypothetical protein
VGGRGFDDEEVWGCGVSGWCTTRAFEEVYAGNMHGSPVHSEGRSSRLVQNHGNVTIESPCGHSCLREKA